MIWEHQSLTRSIAVSLALITAAPLATSAAINGAEPAGVSTPVVALPADRATVELHAHLFMKEGMTWIFRGDFDEPLHAVDWTDRFRSQANPESLERSEIGVVVAALYANPFFTVSLRDSIRRQIAIAEKFVADYPQWVIARDAGQARLALAQGKRVLVLALEGSSGIIETEEDLVEFVDQKGIRIINLLHLTDDVFGGVAYLPGIKALTSPWAWLTQLWHPARDSAGNRINAAGLTNEGRTMARKLLERHVWLDLAHASDRAQAELVPLIRQAQQPLLYTHTVLRKYMGAERGITADQLAQVRASNGVLGIMPSDDMLEGTVVERSRCAADCAMPCEGGLPALATQYDELTQALLPEQVMLGSDYNGGVHHLPRTCPLGTGLDTHGLWNIGQQAAVWDSLEKMHLPVPNPRRRMLDHFLMAWQNVNPPGAPAPAISPTPKGSGL